MATLAAMAEIEAGRYDCVLVLGVEQEKTMPGAEAAGVQAAAAWVGHETEGVDLVWPEPSTRVADEYDRRYGLDDAHLRAIGELNLRNAQAQPQRADPDVEPHPRVLQRRRPRQPGCGRSAPAQRRAARSPTAQPVLVLVCDRWLESRRHEPRARIAGWGHTTVGLPIDQEARAELRRRVRHAPRAAGDHRCLRSVPVSSGTDDLDAIETHDCMTPSEYLAIDHFGITAAGEAWKAVEEGWLERDGKMPVNASGGLIGGGHPVGATGARMLVDSTTQVTGTAGGYQVDGAQRVATLNIGGSTATTASFIVEGSAE